ncbi:cytochrome P450 [Mycena polygramma]|nr:cytochrome P450 [Mycena polygramma]
MDTLLFALVTGILALLLSQKRYHRNKADDIPAVGVSGIWDYYTGGYRYLFRGPDMLSEGCRRYPGRVFRVPRVFRWDFIISGRNLIKEVVNAPEDALSAVVANRDSLQMDFTMGREITDNSYHVDVVRSKLTRNLGKCFPDLHDEIICAFDEILALDGTGWKLVTVLPTIMTVVARTTNRQFVGLPICRNQEYLDLVLQYTFDVAFRAQMISLLPAILQPILGPLISARNKSIRKGMKHLRPLIEYRIAQAKQYGSDWPNKPNDYLSWLLESVNRPEAQTVPDLVSRLLAMNLAGIHTASSVFTHALFDLTAQPRYMTALREEAEKVISELGWTKAAVNKMHKIDSFLRESQRMHDNGPVSMTRKVMDPAGFRFSDGTVLPCGSIVNIATRAEHFDPANYENPHVFDGFRFSKMREDRGEGRLFNRHMISTGLDHLAFGHKLHACPARFFAASELKAMLAHLLIHYDLRAEIEGVRPPDDIFGVVVVPNRRGKIWFRKRLQ